MQKDRIKTEDFCKEYYYFFYYLKPECEKKGWEKFKDGLKSAAQ